MDWEKVVITIQRFRPAVRIKRTGDSSVPEWAPWAIIPTDGYIETGSMGPVAFREVEWIEIDASKTSENGLLIPCIEMKKVVDQIRNECESFAFEGLIARIVVRSQV